MDLDGLHAQSWPTFWTEVAMLACFAIAAAILFGSTSSPTISPELGVQGTPIAVHTTS